MSSQIINWRDRLTAVATFVKTFTMYCVTVFLLFQGFIISCCWLGDTSDTPTKRENTHLPPFPENMSINLKVERKVKQNVLGLKVTQV